MKMQDPYTPGMAWVRPVTSGRLNAPLGYETIDRPRYWSDPEIGVLEDWFDDMVGPIWSRFEGADNSMHRHFPGMHGAVRFEPGRAIQRGPFMLGGGIDTRVAFRVQAEDPDTYGYFEIGLLIPGKMMDGRRSAGCYIAGDPVVSGNWIAFGIGSSGGHSDTGVPLEQPVRFEIMIEADASRVWFLVNSEPLWTAHDAHVPQNELVVLGARHLLVPNALVSDSTYWLDWVKFRQEGSVRR